MTYDQVSQIPDFKYNYDRMMWLDRKTKRGVDVEFRGEVTENETDEWMFFSDTPISDGSRKELIRVLEGGK